MELKKAIGICGIVVLVIAIFLTTKNQSEGIALSNYTLHLNSSSGFCGVQGFSLCTNGTYLMTTKYVGTPQVAWDECISSLEYFQNGKWIKANQTQDNEVLSAYGYIDIQGMC